MVIELHSLKDMLPDPPRTPDMRRHAQLRHVYTALTAHYFNRHDVLLAGGGYLRSNADNQNELLAPDWIVTFGVDPDAIIERNGYVISEVGKPPDFILDIAVQCPEPHDHDYDTRRDGYAGYGVREFWYLDPDAWYSHRSLDIILTGDKLVNGKYVPIPLHRTPDGVIWGHSEVLGLDVRWDRGMTRFRDPSTGEYLPDNREMKESRDVAETERDMERAGRLIAETERDVEREGRLAAEAELRRLREQFRRRYE